MAKGPDEKSSTTKRKRTSPSSSSASPSAGAERGAARWSSAARSADRADKSVEAFRDALERSVTLSRERIQEVVDDAVKRGRMTRDDANEMVSKLVSRGRRQTEDLVTELERLLEGARGEVGGRAERARKGVETQTTKARKQADKLRRRAGVGSDFPIGGYDELTAAQVIARLDDLGEPELRKVRAYERKGKARKTVLGKVESNLG